MEPLTFSGYPLIRGVLVSSGQGSFETEAPVIAGTASSSAATQSVEVSVAGLGVVRVWGSGFWGLEFGVPWGLGLRVRVWGSGFMV